MRQIRNAVVLLLSCCVLVSASPAFALNILLGNDDGFETANIRALYLKLRAAGHSVIVSAPTQNQSGQGGRIEFLRPITPLTAATRYGTVAAGSPGLGRDPQDANINYVDGSPVMALLYGLDVLAPRVCGRAPDLIISGPNEGANTGAVTVSSGTVSNAVYGVNRGIPSIAVSYGDTTSRSYTTLPSDLNASDAAYRVANLVVTLVANLDRARAQSGALLPFGTGLNVNIPAFTASCTPSVFTPARIGIATDFTPVFYQDLSTSPLARSVGITVPLPGISLVGGGVPAPAGVSIPADTSENSEQNILARCAIPVSVLGGASQTIGTNELAVFRILFGN